MDENGQARLDPNGKPMYYCGFSIGGGIDQDHKLSPQKYPDNVIFFKFLFMQFIEIKKISIRSYWFKY